MAPEPTHRPFPAPTRPPLLFMRWVDLIFMHWEIDPEILRRAIPKTLDLDLFHGRAFIAVVPFVMTGVRPRCGPSLPGISRFGEINVRTYVRHRNSPGVWFFTLDANSHLAVRGARAGYHLSYLHSRIRVRSSDGWIDYTSTRTEEPLPAEFAARYRPAGPVFRAAPGSLEHFLTERYLLFAVHAGRVYRGDIDHAPWPLQPAEAQVRRNTMTAPLGITLPDEPPLLHYASSLDVWAWWRKPVLD